MAATSLRTKAKTAAAAAAFWRLLFMVYLFSHFVLHSLRRGKKKYKTTKFIATLKKKKKRPREKKELNELICSVSWGERREGGKKRKTLWNIFQQLFFFELELRRKVVLCLAVCCGAASPPALLQCAAGSEAATHLVSITASHRSSKRL